MITITKKQEERIKALEILERNIQENRPTELEKNIIRNERWLALLPNPKYHTRPKHYQHS